MKFICGKRELRRYEKWRESQDWHLWFAWRPVKVGYEDCRWCEYVWRKNWSGNYVRAYCWMYMPKEIDIKDLTWYDEQKALEEQLPR